MRKLAIRKKKTSNQGRNKRKTTERKKEYNALKKHDIKTLRGMIGGQHKIVDTSEYKTKDHAISAYLRTKHGDKKVATAFGLNESEEHIVHVNDGSKYDEQPHEKDAAHVMAGVKMHGGEFDSHSDKGAFFKFKSHTDAKNFKRHVDSCPHKTCDADLHESRGHDIVKSFLQKRGAWDTPTTCPKCNKAPCACEPKTKIKEGTLQGNIGGGDAMNTTTSAPSASTTKDTTMGKKIKGFKFFNGENDRQMNMNQPVKEEKKDQSFFFAWWEPEKPEADHRLEEIWAQSNPGLNDITDLDEMRSAVLRTPEAEFRTKRLNCFVNTSVAWLPTGAWEALVDEDRYPQIGEDVVLAFDGAFSNDSTALVAWLLGGDKPHLMVVGLWERPDDAEQDWHIPVAEVEETIISTFRDERFSVREIVFDPARWQRTFMVLDEEGLPVVSYPNSAERMVPATQKFYEAVVNQSFTHDGNPALARHIANCVTKQSSRGVMVAKASSRRKVDAAVASIFGYDRATQPAEPAKPVAKFFSIQV